MVEITVESKIDQDKDKKTSILIIGIFENEYESLHLNGIDASLANAINEIINNKDFKAVLGSNIILYMAANGQIKKVMLIGLGKREKFTKETVRIVAGKAALKAKEMGLSDISIIPFSDNLD